MAAAREAVNVNAPVLQVPVLLKLQGKAAGGVRAADPRHIRQTSRIEENWDEEGEMRVQCDTGPGRRTTAPACRHKGEAGGTIFPGEGGTRLGWL